jgi:hypothetical protein
MKRLRTVGLALLSLAVISSCAPAPVKLVGGEQCFRCRRSVNNRRVATEAIYSDHTRLVAKFRGPGCMAQYLVDHPAEKPVIYVTDYTSGRMFAPTKMSFVAELLDRDTGETDYRAYRHEEDAKAAAIELHATPISWDAVLEKTH